MATKGRKRLPKGSYGKINKLISLDKDLFVFLEKLSKTNGDSLNRTINRILGYAYGRKEEEPEEKAD